MIEWILFLVLIGFYVFYVYWRNSDGDIKWLNNWHIKRKPVPINMVKGNVYRENCNVFFHWIDKLNEIIHYTNMRYYVFVDKLPLLKDSEEEVLYCLLIKKGVVSKKKPFFKTYIVTGGLYKEIDISKY